MKHLKHNLQGLDHAALWIIAQIIFDEKLKADRVQDIEREDYDEKVDHIFDDLIKLQDYE